MLEIDRNCRNLGAIHSSVLMVFSFVLKRSSENCTLRQHKLIETFLLTETNVCSICRLVLRFRLICSKIGLLVEKTGGPCFM